VVFFSLGSSVMKLHVHVVLNQGKPNIVSSIQTIRSCCIRVGSHRGRPHSGFGCWLLADGHCSQQRRSPKLGIGRSSTHHFYNDYDSSTRPDSRVSIQIITVRIRYNLCTRNVSCPQRAIPLLENTPAVWRESTMLRLQRYYGPYIQDGLCRSSSSTGLGRDVPGSF